MQYIDQTSADLRLTLTNSFFDKTPLNVIIEKSININGFDLEYGILGASHFVSIKKDGFDLTEIFACIDLKNAESMKLGNYLEITKQTNTIDYSFQGIVYDWETGIAKVLYDNFKKKVNKYDGLSFEFPSKEKPNYQALTSIVVHKRNKTLIVETIHAYPNENKIVITNSIINQILK